MAQFTVEDIPSFSSTWTLEFDTGVIRVVPDLQIDRYKYIVNYTNGADSVTQKMLTSSQLQSALTTILGEAPTFEANRFDEKPF
jgi:hypothetical protein|tara:strand:+ start:68 stop:319 length:252 start_codon:yes stop_codon:yes gene_type:complete